MSAEETEAAVLVEEVTVVEAVGANPGGYGGGEGRRRRWR